MKEYRYQGTVAVSKMEIFLTAVKLLMVTVPFILALAGRWVEDKCSGVHSRLLKGLFTGKRG